MRAHCRIADDRATTPPVDCIIRPLQAVTGAVTVEGLEPCAGGELIEARGARGSGACGRIECGLDLGLGQQVIEIYAGRGRGAGDRGAHIASLDGTDFGHNFPRITTFDPVSATTVPISVGLIWARLARQLSQHRGAAWLVDGIAVPGERR